jgi:hypothetical protein
MAVGGSVLPVEITGYYRDSLETAKILCAVTDEMLSKHLRSTLKERVEHLNMVHKTDWWTVYKLTKLYKICHISRQKLYFDKYAHKPAKHLINL